MCVFLAVIAAVLVALVFEFRLYLRADGVALRGVFSWDLAALEADVAARAARGREPDWLRYESVLSRAFEERDEELRGAAAAVLTTGVAGTIAALLVHGVVTSLVDADALMGNTITELGVALLGSLAGTVANLGILTGKIPALEARFRREREAALASLQKVADANPPRPVDLAAYERALKEKVSEALKESLDRLPGVVEQLWGAVAELAEAVDGIGVSLGATATAATLAAGKLGAATELLAPAAKSLASVGERMENLPDELTESLDQARQRWVDSVEAQCGQIVGDLREHLTTLDRAFDLRLKRQAELLSDIENAIGRVDTTLGGIPPQLVEATRTMSTELAGRFAEASAEALVGTQIFVEARIRELMHHHRDEADQLRNTLAARYEEVRVAIEASAERHLTGVRDITDRWERGEDARAHAAGVAHDRQLDAWSTVHGEATAAWGRAAEHVGRSAERLEGSWRQAAKAEDALGRSAALLEEVAGRIASLEERLEAAMLRGTVVHRDTLGPLYAELIALVRQSRAMHESYVRELRGRVEAIDALIGRVSSELGEPE